MNYIHRNPNEFRCNFHKNTKAPQINPVTEESLHTQNKNTSEVENNKKNDNNNNSNNDNNNNNYYYYYYYYIIIIII